MTAKTSELTWPFAEPPAFGETLEAAPGVRWLRMPLPMSLHHINLYLLEGDTGWTIVDTGISGGETRELWRRIFEGCLKGKPVTRVICTHMHPDQTGQAGFLTELWRAPLLMSHGEYYQARVMSAVMRDGSHWRMSEYFTRAGVAPDLLEKMAELRSNFTPEPEDLPLPSSFIRLSDGDQVQAGGNTWEVMVGRGHSPEHVCLFCRELNLLLSGDQILPVITSNVSVTPTEPFGNPLASWLDSHERFKAALPEDVLVLPAHNAPFRGVQRRLQQLIEHHEERMRLIEESCIEPRVAVDLLPLLFRRKLEGYAMFMGLGECIAHLHCLMARRRIERTLQDGQYLYRSIGPALPARARPGRREAPDEAPVMS